MYCKHAHHVARPVNNQIFQYEIAFYLGSLELNFIGTRAMNRSNENSVIVGILSYDPQIKPLVYVPGNLHIYN